MASDDLVSNLVLKGDDKVKQQFAEVGDAGEQAFQRVNQASQKTTLGDLGDKAKEAGDTIKSKLTGVLNQLPQSFSKLRGLGDAFAKSLSGITDVGDKAEHSLKLIGKGLTSIGKLGGSHELSGVGKTLTLLQKSFGALAAGGIFVGVGAGLGYIATSASEASSEFDVLAAKLKVGTAQFEGLTKIGAGAGLSVADTADAIGNLKSKFKEATATSQEFANKTTAIKDGLDDIQTASYKVQRAYDDLNKTAQQTLVKGIENNRPGDEINADIAKIRSAQADLIDEQAKLDRQQERSQKALRDTAEAADLNKSAFEKLGIPLRDVAGFNRNLEASVKRVAEAFKNYNGPADKAAILQELLGDKSVLLKDAFQKGAAGIDEMKKEGEKLAPSLDKLKGNGSALQTAIGKLGVAWDNTRESFGLRIAPTVTNFITGVTDAIVAARPYIEQFGDYLNKNLWTQQDTDNVKGAINGIKQIGEAIQYVASGQAFDDLKKKLTEVWDEAVKKAEEWKNAVIQYVTDIAQEIYNSVSSSWDRVLEYAKQQWEAFKQQVGKLNPFGGGDQRGASGSYAGGGMINGPGTDKSDSILARLSRGEFVVKAAAVRHYGADLFAALNSMRFGPDRLASALSALAPVPMPMPRFAEGGQVGGGRPIVLNLAGERIGGMTATTAAVNQLQRYATRQALASAGRKPTWHR